MVGLHRSFFRLLPVGVPREVQVVISGLHVVVAYGVCQ